MSAHLGVGTGNAENQMNELIRELVEALEYSPISRGAHQDLTTLSKPIAHPAPTPLKQEAGRKWRMGCRLTRPPQRRRVAFFARHERRALLIAGLVDADANSAWNHPLALRRVQRQNRRKDRR